MKNRGAAPDGVISGRGVRSSGAEDRTQTRRHQHRCSEQMADSGQHSTAVQQAAQVHTLLGIDSHTFTLGIDSRFHVHQMRWDTACGSHSYAWDRFPHTMLGIGSHLLSSPSFPLLHHIIPFRIYGGGERGVCTWVEGVRMEGRVCAHAA